MWVSRLRLDLSKFVLLSTLWVLDLLSLAKLVLNRVPRNMVGVGVMDVVSPVRRPPPVSLPLLMPNMQTNGPVATRRRLQMELPLKWFLCVVPLSALLVLRTAPVRPIVLTQVGLTPPLCRLPLSPGSVPLTARRLVRTSLAPTALTLLVGLIPLPMRMTLLLLKVCIIL